MKTFAKIFCWASIVGAVLLYPAVSGAEVLGAIRVRLVSGDVQVKIAETGEWVPASVNMPLVERDELWVPEGSLSEIQTNNGAYVRLDGNTGVQVLRVDRDSFQFYLPQGRVYVMNDVPTGSVLQFDTPDTSIRAFEASTFRIDIPNRETDLLVLRGSVTVENAGGATRVRAGSMLVLEASGYAELSPLPPPDDWQKWNERRDRIALARGSGYRHLPEELQVYSGDFYEYGRWVYVSTYGFVWTPRVVATRDWAPYRQGRWVWRGGGYVWVGYEPWGWVPYHYGRWSYVARIGWCWVPPSRGDVFWAPGYVGWVRTGNYVGWVPLAPGDIYYGHGNFGRHSVNLTNVNIRQIRVTNVYRNINVGNSITVVNRTTFVTGRPAVVNRNVMGKVREDFARRRNIVVGRPQIKPVGTSYIPVVRKIPEAKRPPTTVRKIDVKELRQSRPLVREPDRSAIRPQAKPRPLEVKQVERPRSTSERTRDSRQSAPPVRESPQVAPPERGRAPESAPPKKVSPQTTPAGRERPQAATSEKGRAPQSAPPERVRPQTVPVERVGPQAAPVERERPQVAPPERKRPKQTTPPERGRPEAAPAERAIPQEEPADDILRETPRSGTVREVPMNRR